jgi:hypothetical protein
MAERDCKLCMGSQICEHARDKHDCRQCFGNAFCEHGRRKRQCKECGGSGICEHNRRKYRCKECRAAKTGAAFPAAKKAAPAKKAAKEKGKYVEYVGERFDKKRDGDEECFGHGTVEQNRGYGKYLVEYENGSNEILDAQQLEFLLAPAPAPAAAPPCNPATAATTKPSASRSFTPPALSESDDLFGDDDDEEETVHEAEETSLTVYWAFCECGTCLDPWTEVAKETSDRLQAGGAGEVFTCNSCLRAQPSSTRSGGESTAQAPPKGAVDKKHALSTTGDGRSPKRAKSQDAATTTTAVGAFKETVSAGIRWFFG